MSADDIIKKLKKNPEFDENMKAFEKFFRKIEKMKFAGKEE